MSDVLHPEVNATPLVSSGDNRAALDLAGGGGGAVNAVDDVGIVAVAVAVVVPAPGAGDVAAVILIATPYSLRNQYYKS